MSRGSSKDGERFNSTASVRSVRSSRSASVYSSGLRGPVLVQWMWGDPRCTIFGHCSARFNPLRWSKRRVASEIVLELEKLFCTEHRHRPIIIWIKDKGITECKDLVHAKALLTGGRSAAAQDWVLAMKADGKGASRWFFAPEVIKKALRELEMNGEDMNAGINHYEVFKEAIRKEGYSTTTVPSCCQSREVSFASHHSAVSQRSSLQQKLEEKAQNRALGVMGKTSSDQNMTPRGSMTWSLSSPRPTTPAAGGTGSTGTRKLLEVPPANQ